MHGFKPSDRLSIVLLSVFVCCFRYRCCSFNEKSITNKEVLAWQGIALGKTRASEEQVILLWLMLQKKKPLTPKGIGKLSNWLADSAISEQIRVYANKGFFHGNKTLKLDNDTPWWKFEILARLLGGER